MFSCEVIEKIREEKETWRLAFIYISPHIFAVTAPEFYTTVLPSLLSHYQMHLTLVAASGHPLTVPHFLSLKLDFPPPFVPTVRV